MMGGGSDSSFPSGVQDGLMIPIYGVSDQELTTISSTTDHQASSSLDTISNSNFLYNLSLLRNKVHQLQSITSIIFNINGHGQPAATESTSVAAVASMGTLIQEIIITASSMMFTCQKKGLGLNKVHDHDQITPPQQNCSTNICHRGIATDFGGEKGQGFYSNTNHDQVIDDHNWYGTESYSPGPGNTSNIALSNSTNHGVQKVDTDHDPQGLDYEPLSPKNYDIIEFDAADLLAKYTHYCQICGKGFKRDANLRMHMRAHGDEYKSSAALSNPLKNNTNGGGGNGGEDQSMKLRPQKYSCPHEGCRWNKKHAKFHPLKSMICVKNHYKRSHCPKMYICKRCNKKQFSVLSDLRTHEKHCGDLKWQCSCGTTFSRKDKLLGHLALFVGHTPSITSLAKMGKANEHVNVNDYIRGN